MRTLSKIQWMFLLLAPLLAKALPPETNPTLDLLLKKGVITQVEHDKAIAETESSKVPMAKPLWNVDPIVKHVTFLGRLQTQYVYSDYEQKGSNAGIATPTDEIYFRRLYVGFKADLDQGFSATVVANFAEPTWSASRSMDRAFISYEGSLGVLEAGFKKVQWGLEENTSSGSLLTIERSATNRFWGEAGGPPGDPQTNTGFGARHTGLFYVRKWNVGAHDSLEYQAALVNPQQGWNTKAINSFGSYSALAYHLHLSEHNVHVFGLNYGSTSAYTSTAACSVPGVCNGGPTMGQIFGFNPYIKSQFNDFIVQAEYLITQIQGNNNSLYSASNAYSTHTPSGYTILTAYKFIPKLEGVLRYSVLNTDGVGTVMGQGIKEGVSSPLSTTSYDTVASYYAGLNYYIANQAIKLQMGYERLNYSNLIAGYLNGTPQFGNGTANADVIRAQMQLNF